MVVFLPINICFCFNVKCLFIKGYIFLQDFKYFLKRVKAMVKKQYVNEDKEKR